MSDSCEKCERIDCWQDSDGDIHCNKRVQDNFKEFERTMQWVNDWIRENVADTPAYSHFLQFRKELAQHLKTRIEMSEIMIDIAKLKVGDKVHYQPDHYGKDKWENGMVKEIPEHTNDAVRVVYNCGGNWDEFENYTSALTNLRDLKLGWKH